MVKLEPLPLRELKEIGVTEKFNDLLAGMPKGTASALEVLVRSDSGLAKYFGIAGTGGEHGCNTGDALDLPSGVTQELDGSLRANAENEAVGAMLKARRLSLGLGVREAARLLEVDPKQLRNVENGKVSFRLDTLRKFCKQLKLDPKIVTYPSM